MRRRRRKRGEENQRVKKTAKKRNKKGKIQKEIMREGNENRIEANGSKGKKKKKKEDVYQVMDRRTQLEGQKEINNIKRKNKEKPKNN